MLFNKAKCMAALHQHVHQPYDWEFQLIYKNRQNHRAGQAKSLIFVALHPYSPECNKVNTYFMSHFRSKARASFS